MGTIEVFTFEVRPYVYGHPDGSMSKTLKVMAQVDGQQYFSERVMPMQPANMTEIEYYTDMAVRVLHEAMDSDRKDKYREEMAAAQAIADGLKLKQEG